MARTKTTRTRVKRTPEIDFDKPIAQEAFAALVGESQQQISRLVRYSVLANNGTAKEWNRQYICFQMGVIFGRQGWAGIEKAMGN